MLNKWVELLPLFVVRWLALRYCEKVSISREGNNRMVAVARPDIYVKDPYISSRQVYEDWTGRKFPGGIQ